MDGARAVGMRDMELQHVARVWIRLITLKRYSDSSDGVCVNNSIDSVVARLTLCG